MSENYDAVFSAVRSRFSPCDPEAAVKEAIGNAFGNAYSAVTILEQEFRATAEEHRRPSVVYKAVLVRDMFSVEPRWIAKFGDFETSGKTPAEAMEGFDKAWREGENFVDEEGE